LLEQENTSLIGLSNTTPFVNLSYVLGHYWSHCFADIFAKWDYGYFITIHKSQGSDYDNVFLDYFDLVNNPKQNERERLIYTGLTRAKSKCHIYCK
jgi:superfamily I DNA/RNA helicase